MSVETKPTDRVEDLASELGEAIAESDTYQRFKAATSAVEADETAQQQIEAFEDRRDEFVLARQQGDATEEDLRALRRAQAELHDLPVMTEYLEAKAGLERELQKVNQIVSDPLLVDFGETAGGCCQD
ncbi:MAG: YlbF family regulator [Natronomonas sp.]